MKKLRNTAAGTALAALLVAGTITPASAASWEDRVPKYSPTWAVCTLFPVFC